MGDYCAVCALCYVANFQSDIFTEMRDLEHKLQCLCVEWFRYWYPKGTIFAIPNGGARNVVTAAKLKAEGVLAGVPDLCVPMARGGFHGLYIELKNGKKGVVSERQRTIMDKLNDEGYKCVVCRSFEEFVQEINDYMK